MDKIKQFIKDNKGCPLTTPAIKQLLVKFMEYLEKELPSMIEEGSTLIKVGYYIYNDELYKYECVEEVPEDYSGTVLQIADDGYFYIINVQHGEEYQYISLCSDMIELYHDTNNHVDITPEHGISKINATSGTPVIVYGEDSNGSLVKGAVDIGTKLYKHIIVVDDTVQSTFVLITTQSSLDLEESFLTNLDSLFDAGILISINRIGALSQLIYDYDNSQLLYFTASGISSISVEYDIVSDTVTTL